MRPRSSLTFLLIALAVVCSGDAVEEPATELGATWTSRPDVEIGDRFEGDAQFSWVPYLRVHDGRVFIFEPRIGRVTVWTTGGERVGRLGREGEGPGEFLFPHRMDFHSSRFWVRDRQRFTFFSPNLEVTGTLRGSVPGIDHRGFPLEARAVLPDSSYFAVPDVPAHVAEGFTDQPPIERWPVYRVSPSEEGWRDRELFSLDGRNRTFALRAPDGGSNWMHFSAQPFADNDLYHLDSARERVIVVRRNLRPAELVIFEVSPQGDTLSRRPVSLEPIPLSSSRREEELSDRTDRILQSAERIQAGNLPSRSEVREWVEDAMYLPAYLPPVSAIQGASNGEIWLRSSEEADSLRTWYALGPDLERDEVRRVLLPEWFDVLDATGTHVWGVRRDSLDVPFVVGRRLEAR